MIQVIGACAGETAMSDIDYEAATLTIREWTLWVAAASLVVSAVVGGLQCFLIWRGLVIMRRAADTRDRALENQRRESDQRHAEAMRAGAERHAEAMKASSDAMKAGAERHAEAMQASADAMKAGAERHAEAMQASADAMKAGAERHAENMAALGAQSRALDALIEGNRAQTASLETLIERTAPGASR